MAMTDPEYMSVQQQMGLLAEIVRDIPLEDFIERANTALSVGHVLDPTLYREAAAKLELVVKHAKALKAFQEAVRGD